MSLTKFALAPDSSSYTVTDGNEVISTVLDGGAARYRRDILGATSTVSVQWVCDRAEFHYVRAFFRSLTGKGALPFLIDLILDNPLPTQHKAYFIPGTMNLTSQKGLSYYVSAQLEVEPAAIDEELDLEYVILFNELGSELFLFEDMLDVIVNTLWADVL